MVQFHLSALLCIIKCFVIGMVLVEVRFKSAVFIFFKGFILCICLFFHSCIFLLKTLNCDVCKIKLKLGVCTVNGQYVVAGGIKLKFSTTVGFDLLYCCCLMAERKFYHNVFSRVKSSEMHLCMHNHETECGGAF